MRSKLDENLDVRLARLMGESGHDVDTVLEEGLSGQPDESVYQACIRSGRVLVTLDLDFSNPIRFPPASTEGIAVLRPRRPVLALIRATLVSVLRETQSTELKGKLWIVEPGRIRVYDPVGEDQG